jgi:hypothetical protein
MRNLYLVLIGLLVCVFGFVACKTPKAANTVSAATTADTFSVYKLERFFAYPVTAREPRFLNSGNLDGDSLSYKQRLQHWYLLYNTKKYVKKYGPLPRFYPGNVTLDEYKKNPPTVPDEYERIMFGNN